MTNKSFFNWSGGKDSALALYYILQEQKIEVDLLLTNVNSFHRRISMHGVREELLDSQAEAISLPLQKVMLPDEPSMDEYNQLMNATLQELRHKGYSRAVFGDIFLEDLKKYREEKLADLNFSAVFPLWKRNTKELIEEFIDLGFQTVVVCTKAELLGPDFIGRIIDRDFLKDLPKNVDPCGENGEFHTFVFDGPIFKEPLPIKKGETVYREYKAPASPNNTCRTPVNPTPMGFWYCDLLPGEKETLAG